MGRVCAFCGAHADSQEHVLPRWMRHYGSSSDFVHRYEDRAGGVVREHTAREPDFRCRMVCTGCNTGWMSDLEERAKPWFLGMAAGTSAPVLDLVTRRWLASWTAKTAIVVGLADTAQGAAQQGQLAVAGRELGQRGAPLPDVAVFVGPHEAPGIATAVRGARIGGRDIWSFAILVPQVAVVAFWLPGKARATMAEPICRFLSPVWPESNLSPVVPWPASPIPAAQAPLVLHMAAECLSVMTS